ncbi:MAG: amino acid permease [Candidatus Magasanikbacteria bacterium]
MVFWLEFSASNYQLLENSMIMADLSIFRPIVILGILAATFSSALTTLTAAPRVLQAMGNNSILPFSDFFAQTSKRGEPKNATFFTTAILAIALPFSSLNSIAPLLTMFFLLTYSMINITVFLEQTLGFVSFRPKFRVPKFVAFYGALGSLIFMFYVDVLAGLVALGFLLAIYTFLVRKKLPEQPGFVRSGLLRAVSEWAIQKVISLDESQKHIWRPHLLFPIKHDEQKLEQNFPIVKSITYPQGSLTALGVHLNDEEKPNREEVQLETTKSLVSQLKKDGIFTSYTEIHAENYINGIGIALEAMKGQFLHPNILFFPEIPNEQKKLEKIIKFTQEGESGLVFFDKDENVGFGSRQNLNVWMPEEIPEDIYAERGYNLSLLVAYRLQRNWSGKITLWTHKAKHKQTLESLIYQARLPESTDIKIIEQNTKSSYIKTSQEDINIFPFRSKKEVEKMIKITKKENKTNFFIKDSGEEDILA